MGKHARLRPRPPRAARTLLDLRQKDRAEQDPDQRRGAPGWGPQERRILDRFARAVRDGRFPNAVLAVEPCRNALLRLCRKTARAGRPAGFPRTRQTVHRQLIFRARELGRPRLLARWHPSELALLDRHARYVARDRYATAREAGRACAEALRRLHDSRPDEFEGIPYRTEATLQHRLWPRVARLRYRWYNSHWDKAERALLERFARETSDGKRGCIREAARVLCRHLARLHARRERTHSGTRPKPARSLSAVSATLFDRVQELGNKRVPNRRWSRAEQRIADRYARRYDRHCRGLLRMNLRTIATLMQADLDRKGWFRSLEACQSRIIEHRKALVGNPGRRQFPPPASDCLTPPLPADLVHSLFFLTNVLTIV
jgi:hypothetical protein